MSLYIYIYIYIRYRIYAQDCQDPMVTIRVPNGAHSAFDLVPDFSHFQGGAALAAGASRSCVGLRDSPTAEAFRV